MLQQEVLTPAALERLLAEVNARLGTAFTTKQFARWREEKYLRPLLREWRGRNGSASGWDKELLAEAMAFASAKSTRNTLGTDASTSELLPLMTLSSTVSVPELEIPPASVLRPFGGLTAARLSETKLCTSVSDPWFQIPPPAA